MRLTDQDLFDLAALWRWLSRDANDHLSEPFLDETPGRAPSEEQVREWAALLERVLDELPLLRGIARDALEDSAMYERGRQAGRAEAPLRRAAP